MTHFPISGIDTYWWLPPLVAFGISLLTSTGGLSGAFVLLPFQVSVLGFTGPAVNSTNLLFNVLAIPSGVYRYYRERRMVWPLAWTLLIGTIPGMFLGAIIRVTVLPDPAKFKPFVGAVLGYIGYRLVRDVALNRNRLSERQLAGEQFRVTNPVFSLKHIAYDFNGRPYRATTLPVLGLSFLVGIVGGAYGIGGGAILAPFLVTVYGLPVYTIAGAALFSTFASSIAGVLIYLLVGLLLGMETSATSPDWLLGTLFGVGGALGIYVGAWLQKYVPSRAIKSFLAACVLFIAVVYISTVLR